MALFAVSYDLVKRKDYPKLWAEFKKLKGHKPVRSVYLLDLKTTTTKLRDHLRQFIDDDDKLIVIRFTGRPAFTKAARGTNAWLAAHCPYPPQQNR